MPTNQSKLTERFAAAKDTLDAVSQDHVLFRYDSLSDVGKDQLLSQIESIDWEELARLVKTHVLASPEMHLPEHIQPAKSYPREPDAELETQYAQAKRLGEQLIYESKIAAFTVAGGQGTRLGFDGPKGTFPATPIRNVSLFQVFAEQILKAQQKYEGTVPWYIMTSRVNHEDTVTFLKQNNYFGLDPENVMCFSQQMMPAMDMETGKVLMNAADSMALSPNGHGGSLKALYTSGALADMKERGVHHIAYVQVDNPNVHVVDPLFLGLHSMQKSQMSSKMLPKAYAKEKLGNFCLVDDKVTVIEYSDLPDELAEERLPNGELRFRAGSIAIHALDVNFVEHINTQAGGFSLPFHRAEKKVPHLNEEGVLISPKTPNGVKLETFVFDALPLCDESIILETDRVEEFAPIKNADAEGAVDSPATSKSLQSERAARWLEAHGVKVARTDDGWVDAVIEIKPTTATDPADLKDFKIPSEIASGDEVLL